MCREYIHDNGCVHREVDVKLVPVDVVVRDRSGKPLATLQEADFRIFEDGVEQSLQSFSNDQAPLAVALVIDRSESVAPRMRRIQSAAYQALQHLKRDDTVCLFSFAGDVQRIEDLTASRQRIANRIGTIKAGGGTRIVEAVDEALRYLQGAAQDRRRAVILISDNTEGNSFTRVDRAPIPSFDHDPVSILTRDTGGEVFSANPVPSTPCSRGAGTTTKQRS
jgi:Ca-activated chloride channel family protein